MKPPFRAPALALLLLAAGATGVLAAAEVIPEPASNTPALAAALVEYRARHDAAAKSAYEAILAADPTCDAAHFYLGRLAKRRKDWVAVEFHWEKCVELQPRFARYHADLAEAYGRRAQQNWLKARGYAARAQRALETAITLEPDVLVYRKGLVLFHLRAPGFVGGSIAKAREQAEEIKRRNPAEGWLTLGRIEAYEKNWAAAEAAFVAAAKSEPANVDAPVELARLLIDRDRPADALARLGEILAREPEHPGALYFFGAAALAAERDLPAGVVALRRYLAQPGHPPPLPTHGEAWAKLGQLLERADERDGARAAYEEALRNEAQHPVAVAGLKRLGI